MRHHGNGRILGVFTVGIPVSDQDRALAFYTDQLGFQTALDEPVEELGGRWIVITTPDSASTIALEPARDERPAGVETGIRLSTDDAAALHASLRRQGVVVDELLEWPGVPPMFAVHDPDGNGFSITEVQSPGR